MGIELFLRAQRATAAIVDEEGVSVPREVLSEAVGAVEALLLAAQAGETFEVGPAAWSVLALSGAGLSGAAMGRVLEGSDNSLEEVLFQHRVQRVTVALLRFARARGLPGRSS